MNAEVKNVYKSNPKTAQAFHFTEVRAMRKEQLNPTITEVIAILDVYSTTTSAATIKSANTALLLIVLVTLLAGCITIGVMCLLFAALRPLHDLQSNIQALTQSNLSKLLPVTRKDEIGELTKSINRMILTLRRLIQDIHSSAEHLDNATTKVQANTADITTIAEQLAITEQTDKAIRNLADLANAQLHQIEKFKTI